MFFLRQVVSSELQAVTHIDGSTRAQTVNRETHSELSHLLDAVAVRIGVGVLCNTSLNYHGCGFINRLSHLTRYCDDRGLDDMVVDGRWYRRRVASVAAHGRGWPKTRAERRPGAATEDSIDRDSLIRSETVLGPTSEVGHEKRIGAP